MSKIIKDIGTICYELCPFYVEITMSHLQNCVCVCVCVCGVCVCVCVCVSVLNMKTL
jgi:hypothetical protein